MFRYLNSIGIQIKFVSTKKPTTSTAAPHTAEFYKWAFLLQDQYWYMNGPNTQCKPIEEAWNPAAGNDLVHCCTIFLWDLGWKYDNKKKSNYKSYSWAPTTRDDCTLRQIRYVRCFFIWISNPWAGSEFNCKVYPLWYDAILKQFYNYW